MANFVTVDVIIIIIDFVNLHRSMFQVLITWDSQSSPAFAAVGASALLH